MNEQLLHPAKNQMTLTLQTRGFCRFADDVIEVSDGSGAYFSDASSRFGLHEWFLDLLEARPNGRLLKFDASTKETTVVLADLVFPNGVALSSDQDFLVVCETWRCAKCFHGIACLLLVSVVFGVLLF
ncbi:hypothetical protein C4D60_Mb11t08430 [Musa balbisiana]|uniref:Strictosidine synthase conserved region domain-containing protein n=1 Tax=Musa balbisiana TaxID=52838 RepID=A0A4S8J453_MUSBA|nr:hypothetical protein C4D60_Mb11t08430 [Musa balbisiana]